MKKLFSCSRALAVLFVGMTLGAADAAAQHTVRGRVTYNPNMSECRYVEICEREMMLGMYPERDWIAPGSAVNIAVKGTNTVVKTDREGNYELTVPSANASLMFMYIGFLRVEVPIEGRSVVDVKLTPTPVAMMERLLEVIMPQIDAGRYPDIDQVAADAQVNRETARDFIWLVIGNRPFVAAYPNEYMPDYRFPDSPLNAPRDPVGMPRSPL